MNLLAMPSPSAFGRRYSARATKIANDDRSGSVTSLQNSSILNKTPPTKLRDTTRESANRAVPQIPKRQASESRRPSFLSHKTEILSGTTRRSINSLPKEDGNSADGSLPDDDVGPSTQLMLEAERALEFESLSEDRSRRSPLSSLTEAVEEVQEEHEVDRSPRGSTRLDINGTTTDAVRLSNAAPERKRRITTDCGLDIMKYREKEEKKISLRTRRIDFVSPASENPAATFVRPLEDLLEVAVTTRGENEQLIAKGSKLKAWLTQGLYVGQDTDPRIEKVFGKRSHPYPPQRSLLLTPLFAGARLLELDRDFKLPFDVFNALPRGQPKPEDWKKLHKNVFIGDAVDIWKKAKHSEDSTCFCTCDSACGETCINRSMFYECDDSNCKIGASFCTNRSFQELRQRSKHGNPYDIGVEVLKTADRGYGVRAMRSFEPNQIIVEYTGEIITQDECDNRMNTVYKNNKSYYLMQFDQQMILDATRGSIARFVNHSCEPNCAMIKWTVSEIPRIALFAGDRGIMTGEELTYDYNFFPYSVKNLERCRCGSASCRGFLGPKPKEAKTPQAGNKRSSQKLPEKTSEKTSMKRYTFKTTSGPKRNSIIGTKRKFEKPFQDSVESATKKRKINLLSSLKTRSETAKARMEKKMREFHLATSAARRSRIMKPVSKLFSMSLRKKAVSGEGISTNTESKRRPSSMTIRRNKKHQDSIPNKTGCFKSPSMSVRGDDERKDSIILSDQESNNKTLSISLRRDEGREKASISTNKRLNWTIEPIIITTPLITYASRRRHPTTSSQPEISTTKGKYNNNIFEKKVKRSTVPERGNTITEDKLNQALEKISKSASEKKRYKSASTMITFGNTKLAPKTAGRCASAHCSIHHDRRLHCRQLQRKARRQPFSQSRDH